MPTVHIPKIPPKNVTQHIYNYGEVRVVFPYKAYPSQEQMMEKIIYGARVGQNCLLESPTGTGKTAALLCSLLAFIRWCYKTGDFGQNIAAEYVKTAGSCSCGLITDPGNTNVTIIKSRFTRKYKLKAETLIPHSQANTQLTQETQKCKLEDQRQESPTKVRKLEALSNSSIQVKSMKDLCMYCIKKHFKEHGPPKIYYATRTHSQIAQVVKQLKSTHYSDVKMTILSSRQQTCINQDLRGDASDTEPRIGLNERCVQLKKNYYFNRKEEKRQREYPNRTKKEKKEECPHFAEPPSLLSKFKGLQQKGAFDIEDLVEYGKGCDKCPYFGSQVLHEEAEIIFCPYNYLIYPDIRENANVNLANSIIVFDEAHNIEDICRSAASFCIDHDRLDLHARKAFDAPLAAHAAIPQAKQGAVQHFSSVLQRLSTWILSCGRTLQIKNNDSQPSMSFLSNDIVCLFRNIGLGPETLGTHLEMYSLLDDEFKDKDEPNLDTTILEEQSNFKVASEGLFFVKEILSILTLMFGGQDMRRLQDFKVVLVNTAKPSLNIASENPHQYKYLLDIICLNPAVAFEPIKNSARCIIVASGTLSPMISFSSELETPFGVDLSADHVVSRSQVWAGVVKCGPRLELKLTKDFQGTPEIQDEIGNVVLQVCEVVPHGVLVFLPSYGFMNILKARWSSFPAHNPLLNRIRKLKIVYFEESKNKEMFKKDMRDYIENIKAPGNNGCILFAVFRGKVSEGIDFADDQARAVITVGIPYSSLYSYETVSKKAYNDIKLKSTSQVGAGHSPGTNKVLSGSEWYKVQAFRAINQGFGRCIRHQKDWGAIIMIDARLNEPNNKAYLSKWVQQHMRTFDDFHKVKGSLSAFVEQQLQVEEELEYLSENDGDDNEILTQVCQMESTMDALTQKCCNNSVRDRQLPGPSRSSSNIIQSRPTEVPFDGDSSAYSLDEFDNDDDDDIFNDVSIEAAVQAAIVKASNKVRVSEQETQLVEPNVVPDSDCSDISYHSESDANMSRDEADISIDMILGTP